MFVSVGMPVKWDTFEAAGSWDKFEAAGSWDRFETVRHGDGNHIM